MNWICSWAERHTGTTTIWRITRFLTINNVRSDSQDRLGWNRFAIHAHLLNLLHEAFNKIAGNVIHTFVVVTEFGIVTFNVEIDSNTIFVTNWSDFSKLDSSQ